MSLFLHYFWRIVLLDVEFLVDRFFPFKILDMSSHCLLAISKWLFSCCFQIPCSSLGLVILPSFIFKGTSLRFSLLEFIQFLCCVYFCLPSNTGCFQTLFLQIFFCPFLSFFFLNSCVFVVTLDSAHSPSGFAHFFHSFFFSCWFFSIALSSNLMIISSCSKLLLNVSNKCFIPVIVFLFGSFW